MAPHSVGSVSITTCQAGQYHPSRCGTQKRQIEATGIRGTGHGGDQRLLEEVGPLGELDGSMREGLEVGLDDFLQVETGAEHLAPAGEDHGLDTRVGLEGAEHRLQLVAQGHAQRVLLPLAVQLDNSQRGCFRDQHPSSRSINLPVREQASFVVTFEAFDFSSRRLEERSDRPLDWPGSQPLPRQEKGKLPGAAIPAG